MKSISRRAFLKVSAAAPFVFSRNSWGGHAVHRGQRAAVVFGFIVPQTGAYSQEGGDELRAFKLAVEHLNGEGDGGLLQTMQPLHLSGNGKWKSTLHH